MWQRFGFALIGGAVLLAGLALLGQGSRDGEAAAGPHTRVLPALAADSVPGAATATPTPTPPGGSTGTDLRVTVILRIVALELSVSPTGTTPVLIEADATVDMPGPQASTAAAGTFSIADHPVDAAGCSWTRFDVSTSFSLVVYNVSAAGVLMGMTSPEWYYIQQCPAPGAPPIRFPAFGEESLELFLRDLMTPYYAGPTSVLLPLNAAAAPGCLKQYGAFSHSGIQADPAQVFVYVHEQGCSLPPLLPLPQPTPAPYP